jgi:hypothetical protein
MVGLQLMRTMELPFGDDRVFTYGPWGFLSAPTGIDLSDLWLAGLFRVAVVMLLFLGIHSCLPKEPWRVPAAAVLSLLTGNCSQSGWILALALCALVLSQLAGSRRPSSWILAGAAALSALTFQIKFSDGVLAIAVVGLLTLVTWSPRAWLVATASFVTSFVGLWLAAGQSLADLPGWLRMAIEMVGGYGEAMAFTSTSWIVWVLVVGSVTAFVAVVVAQSLPLAAKVAALGIILFLTKAALTRPDGPHLLPGYSGLTLVLGVALLASLPIAVRVLAVPVAVVLAMLMLVNLPLLPSRDVSPDAWPVDALPAEHERRLQQVRAELIDELAISADVLTELRAHPVSIDPWEISAAWAYDLDWQPLPVFQDYAAYTPRLDEANATALLADPDHRVLHESAQYVDGYPLWDSPAHTLALVCNFDVLAAADEWSVLARVENRCGAERVTSTRRVAADEQVELPASDGPLFALRFTPDERSLGDRMLGLTGFQRHLLHASLDGSTYRLPESLAGGPLIVSAPAGDPALLGRDPVTTISFDRAGQLEILEIPLTGPESE